MGILSNKLINLNGRKVTPYWTHDVESTSNNCCGVLKTVSNTRAHFEKSR